MLRVCWIVGVLAVAGVASAQPQAAEWWAVDQYVVEQLLERDRGQWVKQLLADPMPDDPVALLVRFDVLVRDGRNDEADKTLGALATQRNALSDHQWSQLADFLIDRQDDDLAVEVMTRVPTAMPGWGYVLVRRLATSDKPTTPLGHFVEMDRWLVKREAAAREAMAQREPPLFEQSPEDYWFSLRLDLYEQADRTPVLLEAMTKQLRERPDDLTAAIRCVTLSTRVDPPQSPRWMPEVVRPASAYDAHRLGEALSSPWPAVAAAVFERSLAMPFGDADEAALRRLDMMRQQRDLGPRTRGDLDHSLRRWTRERLAEAYQQSGQADKAQPLIERLARESGQDVPLQLATLAGRVQAETGARVIEGRIIEQEESQADTPEYWQRRARYFEGRGEHEQAEAAYRKAIELAPLDGPPRFKDMTFRRSLAVGDYVRYLWAQQREADAVALVWREFDIAPPDSEFAQRMVREAWDLDRGDLRLLTVDNERLWRWLAARPTWDYLEDRVLYRMSDWASPARQGEPDHRGEVWARALSLVKDTHPSRAAVLAWVMTRHDANAQAVPLLTDAIDRLEDDDARQRATFTLFEAHLALHEAAEAERLWPVARQRLTGREVPEWLRKIIDAADHAGDPATAARLRKQWTNLDHRYTVDDGRAK